MASGWSCSPSFKSWGAEKLCHNPSPRPPPRSGEGEQDSSSPPLRFGEGAGGRGSETASQAAGRRGLPPGDKGKDRGPTGRREHISAAGLGKRQPLPVPLPFLARADRNRADVAALRGA